MSPSSMRAVSLLTAFLAATGPSMALRLGGPVGINLRDMAERGLNPDGTPFADALNEASPEFRTLVQSSATAAPPKEVITAEYVTLPLDHSGRYKKTFNNRFWVAESGYKPGGPVFIYDAGEADASGNALFRLQNETSFFKQIVDRFNGIGLVWEHRYYGNSTPEPINLNTSADAFEWLTSEAALADVDKFARQFSRKNFKSIDLTPKNTPWVFIGGSYPGMRAAFMREHYPETIFASYASSAPVEARVDMSVYFEPVVRGMRKYGFGNCTNDIISAISYIDRQLESPSNAARIKKQFLGANAAKNGNAEFADALNVLFYYWQSYGVEGGSVGLRNFCDWIETDPVTKMTAPAEGWAKSKGANYTVGRWADWPSFAPSVSSSFTTTCSKNDTAPGDCDLGLRFEDPASVAWTWQYCSEWGFFQSANLGPNQVISKYNSLRHQRDICHRQFPNASPRLLPELPRVERTNDRLGGWDIRPSNTFWSGGEFDPWRTLSPESIEPFSEHFSWTQEIPKCGTKTSKRVVFGNVVPDAQHCYDFRTYFEGGRSTRELFITALGQWLKCFKPKGGY